MVEVNCLELVPTLTYLTLYYGASSPDLSPIHLDPLLIPLQPLQRLQLCVARYTCAWTRPIHALRSATVPAAYEAHLLSLCAILGATLSIIATVPFQARPQSATLAMLFLLLLLLAAAFWAAKRWRLYTLPRALGSGAGWMLLSVVHGPRQRRPPVHTIIQGAVIFGGASLLALLKAALLPSRCLELLELGAAFAVLAAAPLLPGVEAKNREVVWQGAALLSLALILVEAMTSRWFGADAC